MDLNKVLARMQDILDGAESAGRDLTAEEAEEFDRLERQAKGGEQTEQAERQARSERVRQSRSKWNSVEVGEVKNDPFDVDLRRADSQTVLSRARSLVDQSGEVTEHLSTEQRSTVDKLLRTYNDSSDNTDLARRLLATSRPEYRTAFMKFAAGRADEISDPERRAVAEVRALAIGTPSAGGYAVPVVVDPTIILTAQETPNPILRKARVERITTDKWRGLSSAGMSWKWDAEGAASNDNSPAVAAPEVKTFRADGFIPYSIEVEMDWPSFASNMAMLMESGYDELVTAALTNGNGTTAPKGIITAVVAAGGKTVQVATSATLAASDVYKLWAALPQKYRAPGRRNDNAWMSSTSVENIVRQLGTTDPNFTVNLTAEGLQVLMNREFLENDLMPSMPTGTSTDPLLLVGDFKQYLVAQRMGMTVERIQMLFDPANNRPTGQRGMVAYARLGADIVDANAFRLLINR